VKTTDRHRIKIKGLTDRGGNSGNAVFLDMFQFIPVDQDQVWPKLDWEGKLVPKP
jgi:hypothetical protein